MKTAPGLFQEYEPLSVGVDGWGTRVERRDGQRKVGEVGVSCLEEKARLAFSL